MDIRDLVTLRKAKDRMDREFEQTLDVPALARSAAMSTGHSPEASSLRTARVRTVLQEPMDQPYGVRDCAFRDPSGNLIRFNQPQA